MDEQTSGPQPLTKSERSTLRVLQAFAIIGVVGAGIAMVFGIVAPFVMGGVPVPVMVTESAAGVLLDDLPNVTLSDVEGTALVTDAGWGLYALFYASLLVGGTGFLISLIAIAGMAGRMLQGDTFLSQAKSTFIWAAAGVAAAFIGSELIPGVLSMAALESFDGSTALGAVATISSTSFLLIAALGAAAIAFRAGQRAKNDADGLV